MKRIKLKNIYKKKRKKIFQVRKNKYNSISVQTKFLIILIIFLINIFWKNNLTKSEFKQNENKLQYNYCLCVKGRMENLYVREFISYYLSLDVDKFVIAENNPPNTEKFSDVLQDYIKNNTVDILDFVGKKIIEPECNEFMYEKYQDKCKWLIFYDFDEYVKLLSDEGKNIGFNEFLSNNKFNKCEAIIINWVTYDDNELVYYDNRSSIERFTHPQFKNDLNNYVKSIVRGNLNRTLFTKSIHIPEKVIACDTMGNIHTNLYDNLRPPIFKNGYLMHFYSRTAEEFADKNKRGYFDRYVDMNAKIDFFFKINKFSEEKLKVLEKKFNTTFDNVRKKYNKS